jgi:hypothetical protein
MKAKTIPTQKTLVVGRAGDPEIFRRQMQLPPEQEVIVNCPDCFDIMTKIYHSDRLRYHCENCELTIGDVWL